MFNVISENKKDVPMKYFIVIFSLSILTSCFAQDSLTVIHSDRIFYTGDSEEEAIVDHYILSDSSLHFIKLLLADVEFTLPQTVSGSGVRYSNGMDMTWWERADSAMIQHRDSLGNWVTAAVLQIR